MLLGREARQNALCAMGGAMGDEPAPPLSRRGASELLEVFASRRSGLY
jgi:hypothetical protein